MNLKTKVACMFKFNILEYKHVNLHTDREELRNKTLQLQYNYSTITAQLQNNNSKITVQLQYSYSKITVQLQYNYSTITVQLQYNYRTIYTNQYSTFMPR